MTLKKSKRWQGYLLIILILMFLGAKAYSWHWPSGHIQINGHNLKVLVARDYGHWVRGLGGRADLGKYDGMLFLFPTTEQHSFVMRDMKFPLDIVWFDGGTVVDIAPNVPTEPDETESTLTQYPARLPSNSVLELPAGGAERFGIKIGDRFSAK